MEMRAMEDIAIGVDITPPLPAVAFSLYDSALPSHCSACFASLSPSSSSSVPDSTASVLYCSQGCFDADSHLHFSSAEHHLLLHHHHLSHPSTSRFSDTSDLRTALRFLRRLENSGFDSPGDAGLERMGGLLSNHDKLMACENENDEADDVPGRVRDGARAMAMARRTRDGVDSHLTVEETLVLETVLCVVLTNAVEVQDEKGCSLGTAVYDTSFSWINHSCSPNACYRFSLLPFSGSLCSSRLAPAATDRVGDIKLEESWDSGKCDLNIGGVDGYGPRIIVRSIKSTREREEVTVAYTDLLQPKVI